MAMKSMRSVLFAAAAILLSVPAGAQSDEQMLEWSTRTGRMLHAYHAAHAVASAAVERLGGSHDALPLFAAGPWDDGWAFSFGALEDTVFVIRYGVIVRGDGEIERVEPFPERRVASRHHTLAARALARVMDDFQQIRHEQRFDAAAYRFAVLPFPRGRLTAFVSPAPVPGMTLAGSDVMYTLSRDEGEIISRTRFHHAVIALPADPPPNGTAILLVPDAPLPTPVDVSHAIARGAPLMVSAQRGVYLIAADGTISRLPENDPRVRAVREGGR
jgi:hypothetical protein